MLAYPGREKNGNKTIIWDSNDTTIQFVRALQQASCGLHKKHHLHDRLNNHKTRFKVVCTIFCSLNVTSFHTPHNNFKTLSPPSKFQREKWQERLSQILDPLLFSDVFSRFLSGKPTQSYTSGVSHQTKSYGTCADKLPLRLWRRITFETSAFLPLTVANLRFQLTC